MATITTVTTTSGGAFGWPPNTAMDRSPLTNDLWIAFRSADTTVSIYKSTDGGVSWGTQGSFVRPNLYELSEIRIDAAGDHIHMAYLTNNGSQDQLYYRRIQINSGTADYSSGEMIVTQGGTSTPRSYLYGACLFPYKNPDSTFAIVVGLAFNDTGGSGFNLYGVSIKSDAALTTYPNNGILISTRQYKLSGDDTAISVNCDVEHNGDGITSATPNLWFCAQIFDKIYLAKLAWQGPKTGWTTPSSATLIASGRTTVRDLPIRWDGSRLVMMSTSPSDTTKMTVIERNKANTTNTFRTSPAHPQGAINSNVLSWNHVTKDFRLFAVGTSTSTAYYVDYVRATDSWGSWTQVSATAPLTSEWGVRRSTAGRYQYDFYMASGGGSPWTISNSVLAVNFSPTTPTWVFGTGITPEKSGAAFDVSTSLRLDWQHNDPNPTDIQGSYALQRQIGAAAVQWWRTSDSTWQVAETQNTSATTEVTLTTGQWLGGGGASDLAHVYKVRTWDGGGLPSASYSTGLALVPSTRVDPTLVTPTPAQVLGVGIVTATWTVSEQSAFRVTLTNVTTSAVVWDSGFVTGTVLTYDVPVTLLDSFSGSLTLQTKNLEGLTSVTRTVAFTVDFIEPVAPVVSALVAVPNSGGINVTVTQAAVSGAQPATVQMDLWRRRVVSTVATNANPFFETNANDWTNSNYSTIARSTAQFHSGAASLLCTPTGGAATPLAQTTAIYSLTGGSRWEGRVWVRSTTTNKVIRLYLQWYDVALALISSTTRDLNPIANTWIWGYLAGASPSNATGVRLAVGQTGTPAAGDTLYADDLELFPANDDVGIRLAAGITSGATILDWRAASGVDYEYRGYAAAADGTQIYGDWYS